MRHPTIESLYQVFLKFRKVTTDSRQLPEGALFFALKGERFNANQFADMALKNGASYAVIDDPGFYKEGPFILVPDVLVALQELAQYHRRQLKIPFLALTGSNGKTTTKELIREVLERKYRVVATLGNLNNHIGVPLTILSVNDQTEIAVIEMGANHMGEIKHLCGIAQPDLGLITNIGRAHIGEFGSYENIVKAKGELYDYLRASGGDVFVSSQNDQLLALSKGIPRFTYGPQGDCPVKVAEAKPLLAVSYEGFVIKTQLVGEYNFENVAAAIAVGKHFGIGADQIAKALMSYVPSNNRSQVKKTGSRTLIMDAYNANPSSMKAALSNFFEMEGKSKWMILGDMLELGAYEDEEHISILKLIPSDQLSRTLLVGSRFQKAAKGFPGTRCFEDCAGLVKGIRSTVLIPNGALVLIKGSRGIQLEKAVEFL